LLADHLIKAPKANHLLHFAKAGRYNSALSAFATTSRLHFLLKNICPFSTKPNQLGAFSTGVFCHHQPLVLFV
jgi:hypothetical protein